MPTFTLPVDVLEKDDAYILHASVPGISAENVDVTFEDGIPVGLNIYLSR